MIYRATCLKANEFSQRDNNRVFNLDKYNITRYATLFSKLLSIYD